MVLLQNLAPVAFSASIVPGAAPFAAASAFLGVANETSIIIPSDGYSYGIYHVSVGVASADGGGVAGFHGAPIVAVQVNGMTVGSFGLGSTPCYIPLGAGSNVSVIVSAPQGGGLGGICCSGSLGIELLPRVG